MVERGGLEIRPQPSQAVFSSPPQTRYVFGTLRSPTVAYRLVPGLITKYVITL